MTATHVGATAENTLAWIAAQSEIAVPIYQREYRWNTHSCDRLLADLRRTAISSSGIDAHFIGSFLVTGREAVTLVDGQQRVTTLFLLLLAIRQHARHDDDSDVASQIDRIIYRNDHLSGLRLAPHANQAETLRAIDDGTLSEIPLDRRDPISDNFEYLLQEIEDDWQSYWKGIQQVEHVVITLLENRIAQQVFESLNSTGEALVNYEMIHNYIHMGLNSAEQAEVETGWREVETRVEGDSERFWRDFLVLKGANRLDLRGDFGTYAVFKETYSQLGTLENVRTELVDWIKHATLFQEIRHAREQHHLSDEVKLGLIYLADHFSVASPLVLGLYREFRDGKLSEGDFVDLLNRLQSLLIRRELNRRDSDLGLMAKLIQSLGDADSLREAIASKTPPDSLVRVGLKFSLPKATYVLRRLQAVSPLDLEYGTLHIEHIFPQTPSDAWQASPDSRPWSDLSLEERGEYAAFLNTIGNLTLLEETVNTSIGNASFHVKTGSIGNGNTSYLNSRIPAVRELAESKSWDLETISERAATLTEAFLREWPSYGGSDDGTDELPTFVGLPFDQPNSPGDSPEFFEYVEFRPTSQDVSAAQFEVRTIKQLWDSLIPYLWEHHREQLLEYSQFAVDSGRFDFGIVNHGSRSGYKRELGDGYFYYGHQARWQFYATEMRRILEALDLENLVYVKLRDNEI